MKESDVAGNKGDPAILCREENVSRHRSFRLRFKFLVGTGITNCISFGNDYTPVHLSLN